MKFKVGEEHYEAIGGMWFKAEVEGKKGCCSHMRWVESIPEGVVTQIEQFPWEEQNEI